MLSKSQLCDDRDVVMVVDDEVMVEEMIEGLVEVHGCAHASFSDPLKALQYYKENSRRITVLVTDLTMPSMSGPGLIIKVLEVNPELPIILITGHPEEQVPDDIVPLVQQIIPKPFTKDELLKVIRTALAKADHDHRPR